MSEFNIGDKVRTTAALGEIPPGTVGRIKKIEGELWPFELLLEGIAGSYAYSEHEIQLVESVRSENDPVSHPSHYTSHPSGIECIEITQHMSFTLGNAVKYIWRADLKNDAVEDLKKAKWYIEREIAKREA